MTTITEPEIWSLMNQSFRQAIEHTDLLASLPMRGPTYQLLIADLKNIEGTCRQMAHWREDGGSCGMPIGEPGVHGFESLHSDMGEPGWFEMAYTMGQVHQRAGDWLRKFAPRDNFLRLGTVLRRYHTFAERRHHNALGKLGTIMPMLRPDPTHRDTRPVSMSGLLLPPLFRDARRAA